ncbi:hypothetical protein F5Y12DRAFT_714163 [Xylaria sp. FL1777]|nr:hypothetical protein F5Y12DRAFT_714163 [Xylaria sp. FL1777]
MLDTLSKPRAEARKGPVHLNVVVRGDSECGLCLILSLAHKSLPYLISHRAAALVLSTSKNQQPSTSLSSLFCQHSSTFTLVTMSTPHGVNLTNQPTNQPVPTLIAKGKKLEHILVMMKCFEDGAPIDYERLAALRGTNPIDAKFLWSRLKKRYGLKAGNRTEVVVPRGEDLEILMDVVACIIEVPMVNYAAMVEMTGLARCTTHSEVCKLKGTYFTSNRLRLFGVVVEE